MANLTEIVQWDAGVYQLETTDPVQGGASGIANAQGKNLANRTAWLKKHVDDLESGATIPPGIAKSDSQAFTGTNTVPTAAMGNRSLQIANTTFVQDTAHGTLSKSVAGNQNVTLTAAEAGYAILVLTGALTGNIDVIVPATSHSFIIDNRTTGAYTLRVKTAAGTGIYIKQGKRQEVFCDGTNVLQSTTDFTDTELTGTPTAPAATIGDNSSQLVNTSFLQNTIGGVTTVNVAGGSNVTLTQAQWGYGIILLTGALTANINVILPTQNGRWIVCNKTTGNYSITLKTAAGTGSLIRQSESVVAYCDGTNIALAGATPAATFSVSSFTSTAGQTVFNVSYTPGNIMVARNGAILRPGDYTASNGTSITLASAAVADDQIDVYAFASLVIASALTQATADNRYALINSGTLNTPQVNKPTIKDYIEQFQALNPGAAVAVDTANGTLIKITTTQANTTITLPAFQAGRCFVIIIKWGATGHTATFTGGNLVWSNGNAIPAPTSVAGKRDKYVFTCDDEGTMGQDGGRNF